MTTPNEPPEPPVPTAEQVGELLSSPEMARAIESDECKRILDHVPVGIVISWRIANEQRIVYANAAFQELTGLVAAEIDGSPWSVLDIFVHEDDPELTLGQAVASGEDFLGTFRADRAGGTSILAQAYAGVIEDEHGAESYRIAALVDVTDRERAQRDEFERQIRDKDLLLKELQHRVKNNLQFITALIRLEARARNAATRWTSTGSPAVSTRCRCCIRRYPPIIGDRWSTLDRISARSRPCRRARIRSAASTSI